MEKRCDEMKRKIEKMIIELDKIYAMEKRFPQGELICAKNNKNYKWYMKDDKGTFYLSKNEKELAEKLALKKYYTYKKQELESELSAGNSYIRRMVSKEGKAEKLLLHPEYGRLLKKYFVPVSKELLEWQNASYEQSKKHGEHLMVKGIRGNMLRSKSEAIIEMILYKNKIPFRYEEKMILDGIAFFPDFVIRHPVTGTFYYWEHFGMMDEAEYIDQACDKLKIYCRNGIIPSINLITTYETQKRPLSVEKVEDIVQEYFLT